MKATKKILAIAAIVLFLSSLMMTSCRSSRCGGCPTWSFDQVD